MTGIPGDWYETRSLGGGLTLIRERYVAKWLRCNIWHLRGHSPGSIALYEKSTSTLFSGDAVYDGALFDTVYHSRRAVYRESLRRLRELPVSVVYGGHNEIFGRDRMIEIIDAYLAGGRTVGDVSNWIRANG
ncbi:MAG TPA: MBL fold metallo-hydrolase [Aestuariivirga sp.]|nr:MBL fold metallo-hydrolase [Aestuariivirga sp.]